IINIIVTDNNPEFATKLANTLAQVYVIESFKERNRAAQKALEAVKHQRDLAEKALRESEAKVREFREKNKLVTMDGASQQIAGELSKAEQELDAIRSDIQQIDNILEEINRNKKYMYDANLNLLLRKPNRYLEDIQNRLNQAVRDSIKFAEYYTPNHPQIQNLHREINILEKRFIEELKAYKRNLKQSESTALNKVNELENNYKALPLLNLTLANLERERDINTQIFQSLESRYQEALIRASQQIQEVHIIRPAFVPSTPINPTMIGPTTAVGAIIGLILGIVLAFVAETLDTTFSTVDDIEKTLDTTVLGIIPFVDIEDVKETLRKKAEIPPPEEILEMQARLVSHFDPRSSMAESFRNLRTNVHFALMDKGYKTLMVTSSVAGEGKTTIAANLAISLAQIGINTLLVEGDLRRPRISKLFGIAREPGLTDIILRKEPLDSAIRTMSDLMLGLMSLETIGGSTITGIEYLNILPCGTIEKNPSEIVASKLMDKLIGELKERYEIIIFDVPPVMQATDAVVLGSKLDTSVIVYYQGKISRGTLRRAKTQLELLKADVLGVIVNGMRADVSADYSDYKYRYEYRYHEEPKHEKESIFNKMKTFFIKPPAGVSLSFWERLNKGRILLLLLFISALTLGSLFIANKAKRLQKTTTTTIDVSTTKTTQDSTQIVTQPSETLAIKTEMSIDSTITLPSEIEKLRKNLGIKPDSSKISKPKKQTIITQENQAIPETPPKPAPTPQESVPGITTLSDVQTKTPMNNPYVIILNQSNDYNTLTKSIKQLRSKYPTVFITPDFSVRDKKQYALCLGFYPDLNSVNKEVKKLDPNLSLNNKIVQFPYSLLLADFPSEDMAKKFIDQHSNLKYFLFIKTLKEEDKTRYQVLFGAFPSPETAEL
ncbi:MAG: polysaccharide biosynthesis tyrosine autokinase, partial [Candidatus Jordarchaeaceae archaeon]